MVIVYDWDGTLSDSIDAIVMALRMASDRCDLPRLGDEAYRSIIGLSLDAACLRLYPNESVETLAQYADAYRDSFGLDSATLLFEGVEAHLDRMAQLPGVRLAIATGKSRSGLDYALASLRFDGRFAASKTSSEAASKPAPDMLHQIRVELQAERLVMIGDSELDVRMGVAAGAYTIGVNWGVGSHELLTAAGASEVVRSIAELDAALCRYHALSVA